jgi:hypothetical protein
MVAHVTPPLEELAPDPAEEDAKADDDVTMPPELTAAEEEGVKELEPPEVPLVPVLVAALDVVVPLDTAQDDDWPDVLETRVLDGTPRLDVVPTLEEVPPLLEDEALSSSLSAGGQAVARGSRASAMTHLNNRFIVAPRHSPPWKAARRCAPEDGGGGKFDSTSCDQTARRSPGRQPQRVEVGAAQSTRRTMGARGPTPLSTGGETDPSSRDSGERGTGSPTLTTKVDSPRISVTPSLVPGCGVA